MKTLDEVIIALEGSARSGIKDDAIHYLREYRDFQKSAETLDNGDCVSDVKNEPLMKRLIAVLREVRGE